MACDNLSMVSCRALGAAACVAAFAVFTALVPWRWHGREADAWLGEDRELPLRLARGVGAMVGGRLDEQDYGTGSERFDQEWLFGTYMMAAMGFGQLAAAEPEHRAELLSSMEVSLDRLLEIPARRFDAHAWGEDPLDSLADDRGHAAYLGYLGLALALHRSVAGPSRFSDVGDDIVTTLARRFEMAPGHLIETYPGEIYPVDNAACLAAIALHNRLEGGARSEQLATWMESFATYRDARTGLLIQSIDPGSLRAVDAPRGSGTALAAYFLGFCDAPLSRSLFEAARSELVGSVLGFGAVREYPRGSAGRGDIDSGPIVLGYSASATGFLIGPARQHGDDDLFRRLSATAHLLGAPLDRAGRREYVTGGPLGNAILLAMLTAG